MKALRVERGAEAEGLAGMVLCQDVRDEAGRVRFRKGRVLAGADLPELLALPWDELHGLRMDEGELHEDEAGRRIARAVAGPGVRVGDFRAGHWPLESERRGILQVDTDALRRVNSVEAVSVYTLYRGQVIDRGEVIANAKVIPFVIPRERVEAVEAIAAAYDPVVSLRPFLAMRVGAIVQESLGAGAMARFREALGEKIAWFGSELLEPLEVEPEPGAVARALETARSAGAEVLVIAGSRAMDPLDPAFGALDRLDARVERHGVPAHPGSLFWTARLGGVPVLGMPGCGLFSRATIFDLVLPRILAGERMGPDEMAELGHGGLLTRDMAFRFPPYRPSRGRGEVE